MWEEDIPTLIPHCHSQRERTNAEGESKNPYCRRPHVETAASGLQGIAQSFEEDAHENDHACYM
jgi:hypothetical protein